MVNHKDAYTDETIRDRAASVGYEVVQVAREELKGREPYVYLKCKNGHKRDVKASQIKSVKCLFCAGSRFTIDDIHAELANKRFSLQSTVQPSVDAYGNKFTKKSTRMTLSCSEGHTFTTTVLDLLNKNKECPVCTGTHFYAGFSRSEEIIAKVLDYNNVPYERQKLTDNEHENLALDFYLPTLKMVIEYDGEHHKYGRSTDTITQLEETQRRDKVRDDYADSIGCCMVRVEGSVAGKALVYFLATLIEGIDPSDPTYDRIVRDIFNTSAVEYGWNSYETIKVNADFRMNHTQAEITRSCMVSPSVANRHFKWIYGMTKEEYIKNIGKK